MGFSNIATTIIMFIAVLILATSVIITLRTNVDQTQASMRTQADLLNNQIKTNTDITSSNYSAGTTTVYIINNGKTLLKLDRIDIYLDNEFIPRNDSNRTIEIEPSTDTKNPGLWDPNEIVKIEVFKTLGSGTHTSKVTTQYGTIDEDTFSI